MTTTPSGEGSRTAQMSIAAVPDEKGGQDLFGGYEPVPGWPKPLSDLPGHGQWTWGAVQGVFAERPDRVFILQRGELPKVTRPDARTGADLGRSVSLPATGVPFRNATTSSPPAAGASGQLAEEGMSQYIAPIAEGGRGFAVDVDSRWEHCLVVADAEGNIVEAWTQWDSLFRRPHTVFISPYDPEKHVWVVDDHLHAILIFTNDGKELVQTIGTPGESGADATHFNRPTFIAWLADGTFFVSDGYNGTRVAKFDKGGTFLLDWGEPGTRGSETRPYYMNNVHGIALNPRTRRVYVNDRANRRIQVFDESGQYLDEWSVGAAPAEVYSIYMGKDGNVWGADHTTSKMIKWDAEGHFLYSWGSFGDHPGGFWGVHQISVDQEGNLYVAEVNNGRVQKFRPRPGANPEFLLSTPIYSAWC